MAWVDVKKEMTEEKGLDPAVADKIGEYVKHKGQYFSYCPYTNLKYRATGGPALLEQLRADEALMANPSAKHGIEEMGILFSYLKSYKVLDKV